MVLPALKWMFACVLALGMAAGAKPTSVEKSGKESEPMWFSHLNLADVDFIPDDPAEGFKLFRKSAEEGNARAQSNLGLMYANGNGIPQDRAVAAKWFRKAAEQREATAQFNLGTMYLFGEGVSKDSAEAAVWFRRAAEQGLAVAQGCLGELCFIGDVGDGVKRDIAEGLKWVLLAANQGLAGSQHFLGWIYTAGEGVPKDFKEAVKWHRKAAEQGHAESQFLLGVLIAEGDGVEKESAEAVRWFRKAAIQDHRPAQYCLGVFISKGIGAMKSSKESRDWLEKAAMHDYEPAKIWLQTAAEQGDPVAQDYLGFIYRFESFGVKKDFDASVLWYRKAADQGYAESQYQLGKIFRDGLGVEKKLPEAARWFRAAADQGHSQAQFWTGEMYLFGDGVPKNEVEALAWRNLAAASGIEAFVAYRDELEARLGRQIALIAQQRSAEIMRHIQNTPSRQETKDHSAPSPQSHDIPRASGSGVIISRSGHVLTAAHVVTGASRIRIITAQGSRSASVLRIDVANDLAVLKLAEGTYPALPVASSRKVRLGQSVATIGFPNIEIQGFSPKVTRGEISSLNGIGDDPRAWQISAPVQSGNSGGALLDENGNLIGVVVSKLGMKALKATGDIPQNVNYAVKSTYALALLEPYLDAGAPEPNTSATKPPFEDMIAKAQQAAVLILVY